MEGYSKAFNKGVGENDWLSKKDHITLHDFIPGTGTNTAINFQHILETGEVHRFQGANPVQLIPGVSGNQAIDWQSDDKYTRAIEEITDAVTKSIKNDSDLQQLLEKEDWDKEDRALWEEKISRYVSKEAEFTPGFTIYRAKGDILAAAQGAMPVENRPARINDISEDMHTGMNKKHEFDCELMAVTEGVILQKLDNNLLPAEQDAGNLKVQSNYFLAFGQQSLQGHTFGHAYIVSSATGNIVEATAADMRNSLNPYVRNLDPDHTFADHMKGKIFKAENSITYGTYKNSGADHTQAQMEMSGIASPAELQERLQTLVSINADIEVPQKAQKLIDIAIKINYLEDGDGNPNREAGVPKTGAGSPLAKLERQFEAALHELIESGSLIQTMEAIGNEESALENMINEALEKSEGKPQAPQEHQQDMAVRQTM